MPLLARRLTALFAGLVGACAGCAVAAEEPACPGLEPGPTRSVTRVVDGETVGLDDGSELRLIGALAPRAADVGAAPGTWPAEAAAVAELAALMLGRSVALRFGGERSDRFGRLQAQAYLPEGDALRWVQGHLLGQGLARAYTQAGNRACAAALLAAEAIARRERRGLWADAAYRPRRAERAHELTRLAGTFQVVEGRVVRVKQVRGVVYLNFAGAWRRAVTASLRARDLAALGGGADPKALEGRRIRVRGWIAGRRGPAIDLSTAGLIELVDAPPSASGAPDMKPPGLAETGR
jgi:endonuclease YncB( thermonuclease family)